jgi:hypothetical protein
MANLCCSEMMSGPRDRPSEGVPRGTSLFAWGDTPFSGHCSSRQGRRAASRLERAEVQQAPLHGGTGRRAPLRRSRSRDNVASSPSRARTRIGCSCLAFFAVGASSADVARILLCGLPVSSPFSPHGETARRHSHATHARRGRPHSQ